MRFNRTERLTLTLLLVVGAFVAIAPAPAMAQTGGPYTYYAVTPCRVADTRDGTGGVPIAPLVAGTPVTFTVQGKCLIPAGAKAATLNVTITAPSLPGYLTLWPAGTTQPVVSTINFAAGEPALANGAIVPLGATTPDLSILFGSYTTGGRIDVILDVTGYFAP